MEQRSKDILAGVLIVAVNLIVFGYHSGRLGFYADDAGILPGIHPDMSIQQLIWRIASYVTGRNLAAPGWFVGYTLTIMSLWVSSGIFFVPDALPALARDILAYNPLLQVIEWMRSAYYEGYGDLVLDRAYVLSVAAVTLFLGLLLERAMRGHLLAVR